MSDCHDQSTGDSATESRSGESRDPTVETDSSMVADSQCASPSEADTTSQCGGSTSSVDGRGSANTSTRVVMTDGSGERVGEDEPESEGEDVLDLIGGELGLKDKKFMRTVRDINQSPEEFEGTDAGAVAANKTVIANASELSKDAVEYRLTRSDITEDNLGLVKVHPAQVHDRRFGPKSAELTSRGREVLSKLDSQQDSVGSVEVDAETVKQLRARVDALENTEVDLESGDVDPNEVLTEVAQLKEAVDELQSGLEAKVDSVDDRVGSLEDARDEEWGLVRGETKSDLERVLRMAPVTASLWSRVFGIDLVPLVDSGGLSDADVERVQAEAFEALAGAAEGRSPASGESTTPRDAGGDQSPTPTSTASGQASTEEREDSDADISPPDM